MCINQRRIVNRYTGKSMYVNCGHCPACLQQKAAHRVSRIKFNNSDGFTTYLLTLTYARHNAPYILRDDAYKFSKGQLDSLNVYRDIKYRYKRYGHDYDFGCFGTKETHVLTTIEASDDICSIKGVKDLNHEFGKIGVCYYPDLQKFFARLRLNLKRNFNYNGKFSAYCCSEYGTNKKSLRPHFHVLLWIRKSDAALFRAAINKSWSYSNILLWDKSFEEALSAASYVASYVNCTSDFPNFLKKFFPTKHSFSKGFGCGNKLFSLDSILQKFERGSLSYFAQKTINGIPTIVECPIPKYILSRYFPLIKGYSRFTGSAQYEYLSGFTRMYPDDFALKFGFGVKSPILTKKSCGRLIYDEEEFKRISTRLINAYKRFEENTTDYIGLDNYYWFHIRIWDLYRSTCLRIYMQDSRIPLNEKYDNLEYVRDIYSKDYGLPIGFSDDMVVVTDPNMFVTTRQSTASYAEDYATNIKHRSVTNLLLMEQSEEF